MNEWKISLLDLSGEVAVKQECLDLESLKLLELPYPEICPLFKGCGLDVLLCKMTLVEII